MSVGPYQILEMDLKPVHRRILFAMYKGGYDWSKQFRKSARIVGDVIGKYHPHGDQSVYDALVRMVSRLFNEFTFGGRPR